MEAAGPWAGLPEELLDRIFSRLPSFVDRACCSGVCNRWRVAAMQREHAAPPLLPWLLRPSTAGASYFRVFSKTTTEQPVAHGARFCGSLPGGWFVVARHQWRGYALLNLLSGEEVPLPDGFGGHEIPVDLSVGIHPSALAILAATVSPRPTPDARYIVAAIASGEHNAAYWSPGMEHWTPLQPQAARAQDPALARDPALWRRVMLEQFEDVIYYRCDQHEGFYFLTSQERLMVFDSEFDGGGRVQGDLTFYELGGHRVASPPGAGQEVAGRYLVESEGRLLMVKRFISPGRGTVSFQILTLQWTSNKPYWQSSSTVLTGQLLFVGRGCSRAFHTGRSCPGFIYFLDDAEGFHEVPRSEKQYRCSDAGWCCYSTQYIEKRWPQGPRPDCPPWIWLFH